MPNLRAWELTEEEIATARQSIQGNVQDLPTLLEAERRRHHAVVAAQNAKTIKDIAHAIRTDSTLWDIPGLELAAWLEQAAIAAGYEKLEK